MLFCKQHRQSTILLSIKVKSEKNTVKNYRLYLITFNDQQGVKAIDRFNIYGYQTIVSINQEELFGYPFQFLLPVIAMAVKYIESALRDRICQNL